MGPTIPAAPLVLGRLQCRLARRRGRCGREGYQVFVGDLAGAGALEWPLRLLLVIGGFVVATPGGGIMPLSQIQATLLGLAILAPTVLVALLLARRQALVPNQLRAP